jgi:hypothetical protein
MPTSDCRDLFQAADAGVCPKCQSLALVADYEVRDGRIRPASSPARFCFECGYQHPPDTRNGSNDAA